MKNLGKHIKQLRLQLGWTQFIVADKLQISVPAFSKIESGITTVNIDRLKQIADIFNVPAESLFNAQYQESPLATENRIKELQHALAEKDSVILGLQKKLIGLYEEREILIS